MKANLTIKATSPKGAHLITDGTIEFWVRPNCVRKDGTFTPSVFEEYEKRLRWHNERQEFIAQLGGEPRLWAHPKKEGSFRIYIGDRFVPITAWKVGNPLDGDVYHIKAWDSAGYDQSILLELLHRFENKIACHVANRLVVIGAEFKLHLPDGNGGYSVFIR